MSCKKCNKSEQFCGCEPIFEFQGCPVQMDSKCVIYDSKELTRLGIINGQTLEKILKKINASFCEVDTAIDDAFIGTNTGVGAEIYKDTNAYDEEEFRTLIGKGGIKIEQKSDEIEVIIDEDWIKQYYPKFSIKNIGDGINLINEYQPNKYEAKTIKSSDNSVVVSVDSLGGLDIKVNAVELKTASYDKIIPSSSSITIDKNGVFSSDSIYTKVIKSSIESIGETVEGQLKYKFDNESDFTNIDFNQRLYVADKPNVKYVDFAYYPEDSLEPTDKQTVTFVREGKDGAKGDNGQDGKDGENGKDGEDGTSNYIIDLTNDNSSVPATYEGEIIGEIPGTKATVYYGDDISTGWTFSADFTGCEGNINSDGTVIINNLQEDSASVNIRAIKVGHPILDIIYTLSKVRAGAPGEDPIIYFITPSENVIKVDKNGIATPSIINCYQFKKIGNGTPVQTNEKVLKYQIDGGTEQNYTSGIDVVNISKNVTFRLYDGTVILDVETVPLLQDGKDGNNGSGGENGVSSYKSTAFIRSYSVPATPTGGSYASPLPTTSGWSDGIPSGDAPLYASTRIFTNDGQPPQQSVWSTPQVIATTSELEIQFSPTLNAPGNPTDNPTHWAQNATTDTIWMAIRTKTNGNWSTWQVSRIKGENGANGSDGTNGGNGNSVEQRFAKNGSYTVPPALDKSSNDPSGWTTQPPSLDPLQVLWMTIVARNGNTGDIIGQWSDPVRSSGDKGADGSQGIQGVPGPKGDKGDKGDTGPAGPVSDLFVAPRGGWKADANYVGDSKRVEAVTYNGTWYVTRVDAGPVPVGTPPTNTQYWNVADRTYDFIATGLFLAEAAYIENLGVRNLKTSDVGTRVEIKASTNSLEFFSGVIPDAALTITSTGGETSNSANPAFININSQNQGGTYNSSVHIGSDGTTVTAVDQYFALVDPVGGGGFQVPIGAGALIGRFNKSDGNAGNNSQNPRTIFAGVAGESVNTSTDITGKFYGGYFDKLFTRSITYRHDGLQTQDVTMRPDQGFIAHGATNNTFTLPSTVGMISGRAVKITIIKINNSTLTLNSGGGADINYNGTSGSSVTLNARGEYSIYLVEATWQVFKSGT